MKKNLTALCILSAGALGFGISACSDSKGFYTIASDETRELPEQVAEEGNSQDAKKEETTPVAVDSESEFDGDYKSDPKAETRSESTASTKPLSRPSGTPLDEVEVTLDQLIRIGDKIYKIVEAGHPVYRYRQDRTEVGPKGIRNWQELQGWRVPITKRYERVVKNAYGFTVVKMRYRIEFTPGGSYNGKGRFLQAISILPEAVEVAWGYSLDVTVSVPAVYNAGTSQDPIAAAQIVIDSRITTILKDGEFSESYYVRGDGAFIPL